jgi:hypothetical protein
MNLFIDVELDSLEKIMKDCFDAHFKFLTRHSLKLDSI